MSSIYTKEILALAIAASHHPRLDHPTISSNHRAPLCGSQISLDLALDTDRRVIKCGFDARACAFGQASSSLFASHVVGLTFAELSNRTEVMKLWLDAADDAPWSAFRALAPVKALPARHGAVLLPFEAALKAFAMVPAQ
jgi:NifU-like protein involved in Fe-S cluster formation